MDYAIGTFIVCVYFRVFSKRGAVIILSIFVLCGHL